MKILGVSWFCGRANIGIVKTESPTDGIRYFIGTCEGLDESLDTQFIAETGSRFPTGAGDILFQNVTVKG